MSGLLYVQRGLIVYNAACTGSAVLHEKASTWQKIKSDSLSIFLAPRSAIHRYPNDFEFILQENKDLT